VAAYLLYLWAVNASNELWDPKRVVLGIESSCDDTSVAVLRGNRVLANVTANQDVHIQYGGVVPELASRAHQTNIIPVLHQAISQANIRKEEVDLIAYTRGPGLLGSLMVGSAVAKGLALAFKKPLIDVNHMEAHLLAHFIEGADIHGQAPPAFPFICLTISGGHTQLVKVNSVLEMDILGETLDDAAGEAFDKGAKMLGLPYPGGPEIDRLAQRGNPNAFPFPTPQVPAFSFSFSGLKTSLLYLVQNKKEDWIKTHLEDLAASYQQAILHVLLQKLTFTIQETGLHRVVLAGGVSANQGLRNQAIDWAQKHKVQLHIPALSYCTDNGAMIAMAGHLAFHAGRLGHLHHGATAKWQLGSGLVDH
jgi:N6-L-threonylcarbamoyladenine synthase